MNKVDAQNEVKNIGIAYFQDWISDFETITLAVNTILNAIKDDASSSKPAGPGSWEVQEEATRVSIQELRTDELDQILEHYYGLKPNDVGGSRVFFERLHAAVRDGIKNAKRRSAN